jgi:hypothetical protein
VDYAKTITDADMTYADGSTDKESLIKLASKIIHDVVHKNIVETTKSALSKHYYQDLLPLLQTNIRNFTKSEIDDTTTAYFALGSRGARII